MLLNYWEIYLLTAVTLCRWTLASSDSAGLHFYIKLSWALKRRVQVFGPKDLIRFLGGMLSLFPVSKAYSEMHSLRSVPHLHFLPRPDLALFTYHK